MSDFLMRLINRHMGMEEQVQPRARSRFEPGPAAAFLSSVVEEYPSPISSSTVDANTPVNPFPTPRDGDIQPSGENTQRFFRGPRGGRGAEGLPESAASMPLTASDPSTGPPAPGASPSLMPVGKGLRANLQGPPVVENIAPPVHATPEPVRRERKATTDKKEPSTSGVFNHVIPVVTLNTQGDSPGRQSRQQPPAEEEAPPVFTPLRDTGPAVKGLLEAPAWLTERQKQVHNGLFLNGSKPGGEPVVHVTIGRIEVRAVKQQEPPPAPEPPRPREKPSGIMSLDQYLNRCKQGGKP